MGRARFPELEYCIGNCTAVKTQAILTVTRKDLYNHPPAGFLSRIRLLVTEDKHYDLQVLMRSKEAGIFELPDKFLDLCSIMDPSGGYKFCPGFGINEYDSDYYSIIRYDLKNVRRILDPIARIDSIKCVFWHKLAKNASIFEKSMNSVLCSSCKRLRSDLRQRVKSCSEVTSFDKENRLQPSSTFPTKYLSPASKNKRIKLTQLERKNDKKLLKKYEFTDVVLEDEQHEEMSRIVEKISSQNFIDDLFSSMTGESKKMLRDLWENDKRNIKGEYEKDQKKNGKLSDEGIYMSLAPIMYDIVYTYLYQILCLFIIVQILVIGEIDGVW